MSSSQPVTPAQELITCAMIATIIVCFAVNYLLISSLNIDSIGGYLMLAVGTFVTTAYVVPKLTAYWIGRPLDEIMDESTTVESSIESTDTFK